MPLPQLLRLLVAIRRFGYAWIIPCCVAAVAFTTRMKAAGLQDSISLIRTNRAICDAIATSQTNYQIPIDKENGHQDLRVEKPEEFTHRMRGWFVLPESLLGSGPQKHEGEGFEKSENSSASVNYFDRLHQDLRMCDEEVHSHLVAGSDKDPPEKIIIQLIFFRETIDCLLWKAVSLRDNDLEPCPTLDRSGFDLQHGYPGDPSKAQKHRRDMNRALSKYCLPCTVAQGGHGKAKKELDLTEGGLATLKGQTLKPSRYFIRQEKDKQRKLDSPKSQDCEEDICEAKDLAKACSKEPSKIKSTIRSTCRMCYPARDEDAIKKHCQKRRRREREILYLLLAVLITLIFSAAFLVILHDYRTRNREPDGEPPQTSLRRGWPLSLVKPPTLGWKTLRRPTRSWYPGFLQSLKRRRAPLDVERDPAWFDADAYFRKQDDPHNSWANNEEMQSIPRTVRKDSAMSDTLKLRRVGGHYAAPDEEKVPVMPPARSSSVQLPSTSVDARSQEVLRDLVNRSEANNHNRHYATVHAKSPTKRVALTRAASRTLQ